MSSSRQLVPIFAAAAFLVAVTAHAARIDMKDPRRALGREDDIRVDCELAQDTISRSSPISVTYRIQNLTNEPIAIADKVSSVTYDEDARTITLAIGTEIPNETMPHLVIIEPGAKKTLTSGGVFNVPIASSSAQSVHAPMYVQVRVNVLRDLTAFRDLIVKSEQAVKPVALPDSLFDPWIDATDTIFCNTIPVHWTAGAPKGEPPTAEQRMPTAGAW
jgi:hypothetical protein